MKPKSVAPKDSLAPWFYSIPVGKTTLQSMMKTMFSDGGLGKGVTNHSLMKQQSCFTAMSQKS